MHTADGVQFLNDHPKCTSATAMQARAHVPIILCLFAQTNITDAHEANLRPGELASATSMVCAWCV